MFDWNANPESLAARAAELSLEQLDRLDIYMKQNGPESGVDFYINDRFEAGISNHIAKLMSSYAILKGYVPASRLRE